MTDTFLKSFKEATYSNNIHVFDVCLGPAWEAWGGIEVERNEQQSDRADTHDQHMFYPICFDPGEGSFSA